MRNAVIASIALLLAACGGEDEGKSSNVQALDCAWLAGQDNCWRTALEEAGACSPDSMSFGTFSADRTACTYDSGERVELGAPAPTDGDFHDWDVTVFDSADQTCVHVLDHSNGDEPVVEVTTASGTVRVESSFTSVRITCQDGTVYSGSSMDLLSGCMESLPGTGSSSSGESASYSLVGDGSFGGPTLFSCQAPATGG